MTSLREEEQVESVSQYDDARLIKLVQQGREDAFVVLMRRYKEPIINFAYRFLGNHDDAIDVAQETFVRLFRYAGTYMGEVKFSTWLYTIASNLAKTELAKYWRKNSVAFSRLSKDDEGAAEWDVADESYLPDATVDASIIAQKVQAALMRISPSYREVVVLRDIQQLSYEEIAEITQIEIGTVKSRINRGRAQLQEQLKEVYEEMFPS